MDIYISIFQIVRTTSVSRGSSGVEIGNVSLNPGLVMEMMIVVTARMNCHIILSVVSLAEKIETCQIMDINS